MLGERGTLDSHTPHQDLARPLPCGPGALSLLQFTKTAALTLAGGGRMVPWHKASCRMLVGQQTGFSAFRALGVFGAQKDRRTNAMRRDFSSFYLLLPLPVQLNNLCSRLRCNYYHMKANYPNFEHP
ncbi:hypothetical protein NDU88_003026 [Pleurodeles waltl]|uniref:Uncharacterized protein n=1 Tax=Pleurodeles waltl TaxID=8319 RepID=A0AAV7VC95_PLEWA|nr:hypothetical protein NDU88_003026 [Pleurodeles waltl]